MPDITTELGNVIQNYWYVFVILVLGALVINFFIKSRKTALKPVQRSEVERENFLARMSANYTPFDRIKQNGKNKYAIKKLQISKKKDGDKETTIYEMVLQPLFYGMFPLGKENGYVFNAENIEYDFAEPKTLVLKSGATVWLRTGIYVDNSFTKGMVEYFTREYTAQTDLETLSSEYYAMGQENSVIQPDRARATLSEHLQIERVKEERKKQQLGS